MPFSQISHVYQGKYIYICLCQRRRVYASTFGCKPKKRVGIQNGHYSRFARHTFYVNNTGKSICLHSICLLFKIYADLILPA